MLCGILLGMLFYLHYEVGDTLVYFENAQTLSQLRFADAALLPGPRVRTRLVDERALSALPAYRADRDSVVVAHAGSKSHKSSRRRARVQWLERV